MRKIVAVCAAVMFIIVLTCNPAAAYGYLEMPVSEVKVSIYSMPGQLLINGIPASSFVLWGISAPLYADGIVAPAWCADPMCPQAPFALPTNVWYNATLYSSYDPNLPSCAKDGRDWNRINYIVNQDASLGDMEQEEIWYFTATPPPMPMPSESDGRSIIANALNNGANYHPPSELDEAIVVFISCQVQTIFTQFRGATVAASLPPVTPPTVPPPQISVPSPPAAPPPLVSAPVPTPASVPFAIPTSVVAVAGIVGLAVVVGASAGLYTSKRDKESEPEEDEPQRNPLPPIPVEQALGVEH